MAITEVSKLLNTAKLSTAALETPNTFQTSEEVVAEQATPKIPEGAFKTSEEIYAEIQGRNLLPYERDFYFQNTRQILNSLGVSDVSDEDIMSYLDANDLQGLDNAILTHYRKNLDDGRADQYRAILEDTKMPYMDKVEALKKLKVKEKDINEEVDPRKIAEIRAKLTADLLTKQEKLPGRTEESKKALQDTAYKTTLLAQAIMKNIKTREDRSSIWGFENFVENFATGTRFWKSGLLNESLSSKGYIRDTSIGENIKKSTLTGSGLSDMAEDVWNLPPEKFAEAVEYLSSDKPYTNAITTNVNYLTQAEVLGALMGMYGTTRSAGTQNALDVLSVINAAQKVKALKGLKGKAPLQATKIVPEKRWLTYDNIIDAEFEEVVKPEQIAKQTSALPAPLKTLPSPSAPVKGKGFVMLNDPTGSVMTKGPGLMGSTSKIAPSVTASKTLSEVAKGVSGGNTLYHGTSTGGFDRFNIADKSKYGLFGQGVYATDNLDIAKTYMNKGKGTTPMIYEVKMDIKKPVDMDAPGEVSFAKALFGQDLDDPTNSKLTDREIIDYITEGEGDQYKSIQDLIDKKHWKNEDIFRRFEEEIEMSEIPEYEAGDIVFEALNNAGYDGIKYQGGRQGGTKHNVYVALDDSQVQIINKESFGSKDIPVTPAQAATQSFVKGEPIVGELTIGGRQAATKAVQTKIAADVPVTPSELVAFAPDIATGNEKAVPGDARVFKKQVTPLMDLDAIRDSTDTKFLTVEDLDPNAALKLENAAKLKILNSQTALNNNALDIKTDMSLTEPQLGGLLLKEVYGVGPKGASALSEKTAQALTKKEEALNGFKVLEDVNGDKWLVRESYIPYDTNMASPIEWSNFSPFDNIRPYLESVGGVLPSELSGAAYQAVGYQAGLRDILTNNIKKSFGKLSKAQKNLVDSIIQDEHINKLYYNDEELLDAAGGDTAVIKAYKDLKELNRLNASILNYLVRQEAIQKGNMWIRPNKALVDAGLQDLAFELGDGVHTGRSVKTMPNPSKDFVAKIGADGKGVIYKPNTKIPVDDTSENIILLDPPAKLGHDLVTHIVLPKTSSAITVAPLPSRIIGDDVWSGLRYKDKYYIKTQRSAYDSAGRPDPYVKNIVTASSPAQARAIIKKFNKIGDTLERLEQGLIGLQQANEILELNALQGKAPLEHTFTSVDGVMDWMDAHKVTSQDLANLYFERDKFTPLSNIQVDADTSLVTAGNLATRFKRTNDIINPTFDANKPRYVNVTDYIANTINLAATRQGLVPTYNIIAQRLFKTAMNGGILRDNLGPINPIAFMRDPEIYIKPEIKKASQETYQKVKLISDMINQAMDQLVSEPTKYDSFKNGIIDRLVQSTIPGASTLGDLLVNGKDPISLLHSAMYSAYFSLKPAQIFIQTFLTTAYSMALSPIETTRAAALSIPMMNIMQSLRHGVNAKEMAMAMSKWPALVENITGLDHQDLLVLAQECRRLGYGQLAFNDVRKNTLPSQANNFILTPFEFGNMMARMIGTLTAALRESEQTGKAIKDFTNKNWMQVAKNSDALSGGSSRANRRAMNRVPILNEVAMFSSFVINQLETFYGKKLNLKFGNKLAVFGTTLLMFGASKFLGDTASQKVGMWATDKVKKDLGVDVNPNNFAGGMVAWGLSSMLGYDVSLGSNAPHELDVFFLNYLESLISDKDADMRPALVSFLSNAASSISDIYSIITSPYNPEDFHSLSIADRVEYTAKTIMRNISGYSDAEKVWYAYNENKWIDRQGYDRLAADAPRIELTKKALVNFFAGIKPIYETGSEEYSIKEYEKDIHANWSAGKKLAIKAGIELRDLLIQQENSKDSVNPDAIRQADAMYHTTLALLTQDMTEEQKDKMLQDVTRAILSSTDDTKKQIISRMMNPYIKDSSAIQYYNEQRRVNLGGTPKEELEKPKEPALDSKGRVRIKKRKE